MMNVQRKIALFALLGLVVTSSVGAATDPAASTPSIFQRFTTPFAARLQAYRDSHSTRPQILPSDKYATHSHAARTAQAAFCRQQHASPAATTSIARLHQTASRKIQDFLDDTSILALARTSKALPLVKVAQKRIDTATSDKIVFPRDLVLPAGFELTDDIMDLLKTTIIAKNVQPNADDQFVITYDFVMQAIAVAQEIAVTNSSEHVGLTERIKQLGTLACAIHKKPYVEAIARAKADLATTPTLSAARGLIPATSVDPLALCLVWHKYHHAKEDENLIDCLNLKSMINNDETTDTLIINFRSLPGEYTSSFHSAKISLIINLALALYPEKTTLKISDICPVCAEPSSLATTIASEYLVNLSVNGNSLSVFQCCLPELKTASFFGFHGFNPSVMEFNNGYLPQLGNLLIEGTAMLLKGIFPALATITIKQVASSPEITGHFPNLTTLTVEEGIHGKTIKQSDITPDLLAMVEKNKIKIEEQSKISAGCAIQ